MTTIRFDGNLGNIPPETFDAYVKAANELAEAISGHLITWHESRFQYRGWESMIPMQRSDEVRAILYKHNLLHHHWQRGLIATEDIGDLLDACQLELVEQVQRENAVRAKQEKALFGEYDKYLYRPFLNDKRNVAISPYVHVPPD